MKRKILILIVLLTTQLSINKIHSQVTIGSTEAPISGALLDLKEHSPSVNGTTASKGLLIPRVVLDDLTTLKMGDLTIPNSGNSYAEHTGLIVYNVKDEIPICPGLYVWDGAQWLKMGEECKTLITVSNKGTWYFNSGQDLSPIEPQTFDISWETPGTISTNSPSLITVNPAVSSWESTGTLVTATPKAMTLIEVDDSQGNPFLTKEGTYIITLKQGSVVLETLEILMNQTNKALLGNEKYVPEGIYAGGIEGDVKEMSVKITSNGRWKYKEMFPTETSGGLKPSLSNLTVAGADLIKGSTHGSEFNSGGANEEVVIDFKVEVAKSKSTYNYFILEDAAPTKRFNDLIVPVFQCGTVFDTKQPRMSEWAKAAGFEGVTDSFVSDAADQTAKINTPHPITGIAWHRDQDKNVFLSSNFGKDPIKNDLRFMINNLSVISYDPIRTDGSTYDSSIKMEFWAGTQKYGTAGEYSDAQKTDTRKFAMAYAGGDKGLGSTDASSIENAEDPRQYERDPRLGVLYNWKAATMGVGANDGEGAISSVKYPKVQGVCPAGWHVPSSEDLEKLETEFITSFKNFSLLGALAPVGFNYTQMSQLPYGSRGGLMGKAWKEACQDYDVDAYLNGTILMSKAGASNPISTILRPGMEVMLSGYANAGVTTFRNYDTGVTPTFNMWTTTTGTSYGVGQIPYAYCRSIDSFGIVNTNTPKSAQYSIRCQKDVD